MTDFDDIVASYPVNGVAKRVVRQHDISSSIYATREDLCQQLERLRDRRVELKKLMGITNTRQQKNFMLRFNRYQRGKKPRKPKEHKSWRLVQEYIDTGKNMLKITDEIRRKNQEQQ